MLARAHRLAHGRDIARVFSRGAWGTSGALTVKAAPNGSGKSRVVVVVSKKVSRRATVRNRIRRRLAALIAAQWETVTPGYDIVVTVRSDVAAAPGEELTSDFVQAAQRARIITPS